MRSLYQSSCRCNASSDLSLMVIGERCNYIVMSIGLLNPISRNVIRGSRIADRGACERGLKQAAPRPRRRPRKPQSQRGGNLGTLGARPRSAGLPSGFAGEVRRRGIERAKPSRNPLRRVSENINCGPSNAWSQ